MDLSPRPPLIPALRPSLRECARRSFTKPLLRRGDAPALAVAALAAARPCPTRASVAEGLPYETCCVTGRASARARRAAVGARVSSAAKYDDSINVLYQVIVPPVLTLCRNLGHDWLAACLPCLSACLLACLPARLPASVVGAPDLGISRVLSAHFFPFSFLFHGASSSPKIIVTCFFIVSGC